LAVYWDLCLWCVKSISLISLPHKKTAEKSQDWHVSVKNSSFPFLVGNLETQQEKYLTLVLNCKKRRQHGREWHWTQGNNDENPSLNGFTVLFHVNSGNLNQKKRPFYYTMVEHFQAIANPCSFFASWTLVVKQKLGSDTKIMYASGNPS
jgi:hypothetical protein